MKVDRALIGLSFLLVWQTVLTAQIRPSDGEREHRIMFAFADSSVGWAIGEIRTGGLLKDSSRSRTLHPSVVMQTMDGGRSWDLQTVISAVDNSWKIRSFFALDRMHAWALMTQADEEKTIVLSTADGAKWKASDFTAGDVEPRVITFSDALHGWIIAGDLAADNIYSTKDGGK